MEAEREQTSSKVVREKSWVELTGQEQIELLRQELIAVRLTLGYAMELARRANEKADQHQHGNDGRPMFPGHMLGAGGVSPGSAKDRLA